jgi:hypothetical protein
MRYAIWAAVSTKPQAAAGKLSLPSQVERCRQAALAHAWTESAGPFIVPGQSRTRYISLRDAEAAIPELAEMLNSAQARRFDVLVMVDLNRFRELMDQVFRTLSGYGIQLYALQSPFEPVPPERYDLETAQTVGMLVGINQITSRAEVNQIRLKYKIGIPNRIKNGLPFQLPWGYVYHRTGDRSLDRLAIPQPDPPRAALLVALKDELLRGRSIRQLCDQLVISGYAPPRGLVWHPQTVRDILRNPFYAGQVRFGLSTTTYDSRSDLSLKTRRPAPLHSAPGKHIPIWDNATHQAILDELARRGKDYRGRSNNQFTGLMHCGECDAAEWMNYNGKRGPSRQIWRCSKNPSTHPKLPHVDALQRIGQALARSLPAKSEQLHALPPAGQNDALLTTLADLRRQRARLEEAYLAGTFPLETYSARSVGLEERLHALQAQLANKDAQLRRRGAWAEQLTQLGNLAESLPAWLASDDPAHVNLLLHQLLDAIVIMQDGSVDLRYKA